MNKATEPSVATPAPFPENYLEKSQHYYLHPKVRTGRVNELTARDLAILRRIGQGQVASLELLYTLFWVIGNNSSSGDSSHKGNCATQAKPPKIEAVRWRLAQLVGSGYLETAFTNARKPNEQVYALRAKGASCLSVLEQERITVGLPRSNEMRQQLDAQEARLQLELYLAGRNQGEKLIDWKSEHEIRSEAFQKRSQLQMELGRQLTEEELEALPELPDAIATIEQSADTHEGSPSPPTYQLDLEIDGAYYRTMLKAKVASYAQVCAETGRPLLWVTRSQTRAKHLEREIALVRARQFIQVLVLPKDLAASVIQQLYPGYNTLPAAKD